MRRELLTTFIRLEDSKSLQTVIDCCMKILGQGQALIILVMHLLECDRIEQAKKVLQVLDQSIKTSLNMFLIVLFLYFFFHF